MQKPSTCDLFISACEASADAHAAPIIKRLRQETSSLTIEGIAGPKMRKEKMITFLPMEEFQVMGFFDVITSLPKLFKLFRKVKKRILEKNPKALLCIDYPEFHMHLENSLKKSGYKGKIFHYVAPSVWAWRKKRAEKLATGCDHLFTIFPFEKKYFSHTTLPVSYVGNPLLEEIANFTHPKNISKQQIIAIFPGSRKKEIEANLAIQVKVAEKLSNRFGMQICCCIPPNILHNPLPKHIEKIPSERKYELMQSASLALATSGTVNLELALHATPTVVSYAIAKRDYLLAKYIFRISLPYYCMVNILSGKKIFPELFGPHFTEENLYYYAERFLSEKEQYAECQKNCRDLTRLMGEKKASEEIVTHLLSKIS